MRSARHVNDNVILLERCTMVRELHCTAKQTGQPSSFVMALYAPILCEPCHHRRCADGVLIARRLTLR